MAQITFRSPVDIGAASVLSRQPRVSAALTPGATSSATTITALSGEVATVTALVDLYVAVAAAPVAVVGAGDLVPAGTTLILGGMIAGDKVAVIAAA